MDFAEKAHHTSAKYPADVSEFEVTGLKEVFKNDFYATFVSHSPVQIGLKFNEEHHIESNGTILVIGEIIDLHVDENLLENDGYINLSKAGVAAISGLDAYSVPLKTMRYGYQRPREQKPQINEVHLKNTN